MNIQYLSLNEKHKVFDLAKEVAFEWWVDELNCSESFRRQIIEMTYEDAMKKLNNKTLCTVIHRKFPPENHIEVGFRTMDTETDYFLWLNVGPEHFDKFKMYL